MNDLRIGFAFGLHKIAEGEEAKTVFNKRFINITNICSYIPGVGTIVGIVRIVFASVKLKNVLMNKERSFYMVELHRGIFELSSFGLFIFGIPDWLATLNRRIVD